MPKFAGPNTPMKLLTINSDPTAGGSTISLLHLLAGLKTKGVDPLVVIPSVGYCSEQLEMLQIPYRINPYVSLHVWPSLKRASDLWKFLPRLIRNRIYGFLAYRRLKKEIEAFRPDMIHSNNSLIGIGFRIARRYKLPHIWHIREYGDMDFGLKYFPSERRRRRQLSESYAIAITNRLARHFRLSDKCRIIYNGICPASDETVDCRKENYFLYVGAVNENKGVTDLVSAYIDYCDSSEGDRLLVIGRYQNRYLTRLKKLLRGTRAESRIQFLGQTKTPYAYMQQAKAMIVPSKYEGFGRITAEAMFNGCLVIGRNTGGTQEQFDNGLALTGREIGLRFSTTQELASALHRVNASSGTERRIIMQDARTTVRTLYSIENNVEKTYEFLIECQSKFPNRTQARRIG